MSAMDYYSCYCPCDDGSVASVFSQYTIKKCRKDHQCNECHGTILKGEPYEYVFGIWDGDAQIYKTCIRCQELHDWAKISMPCFCFCYGELHDAIWEMVQEVSPHVPGFFFEFGRRYVKMKQHRKAHPYVRPDHQRHSPESQSP